MIKLRRKWIVTVAAFAALIAVPWSLRWYQVRQVSRQLREIESKGEPLTFAEILEGYKTPPRDATSLWMEAFSLLQAIPEEDPETLDKLPFVGFADEPSGDLWENVGLAEKYVKQRAEVDARLQAAADMGGEARFPVDPASGFLGFLHPSGLLDAHNLLRLETHLYAYRTDVRRCAASIRARLALARSLQNSPASTSQTLNRTITVIALRDLERFFDVPFSDDELRQFQSLVRDVHEPAGLTLQCLALRAEGVSMFREPQAARAYFDSYNQLLSLPQLEVPKQFLGLKKIPAHQRVFWSFFKPWDFHFFVSTTDQLVSASRCSWPEAIDRAEQIQKDLDQQRQASFPAARLLTNMLVKSPAGTFTSVARHVAHSRVCDAAIGVELFRRRSGRLPVSLQELLPEYLLELPVDPFSGQPLKFVVGDRVFAVYSVGADRIDDQGDGGDWGDEPDVTFRVDIAPRAEPGGQATD